MDITMYLFAKERNSTATPGDVPSYTYDCVIKEPFNLLSPTLIFAVDGLPSWNYCYIPSFQRYYFVDDWTFVNGRWFATTSIDVLATNRDAILDTTQYVLRSASNFDENLADSYYPTQSIYQYTLYKDEIDYWDDFDGCYVCQINGGTGGGEVGLYLFTPEQFESFREFLLTNTEWCGLQSATDEISETLGKMLVNPLEYIISCRWYPITSGLVSTADDVDTIPIGWWNVKCKAFRLRRSTFSYPFKPFTLDDHPQVKRGKWTNLNPYSTLRAVFPPFGQFDIPLQEFEYFRSVREIRPSVEVDFLTGDAVLYIKSPFRTVEYMSAHLGVTVPLYMQTYDVSNVQGAIQLSGAAALLGNINYASEYWASTAKGTKKVDADYYARYQGVGEVGRVTVPTSIDIGGAVEDFVSGLATSMAQLQSTSDPASRVIYLQDPFFVLCHVLLVDDDNERNGRPLAKKYKLSRLSGYTTCQNPHVALDITTQENAAINAFLANGIRIE